MNNGIFSIKRFLYGLCGCCCLIACHNEEALRQALIEKTVKEKVANHQKRKTAVCNKEIMQKAIELADSLMIKLALSKSDSSKNIVKPAKPVRPNISLPVDTTPIKPLFEDTLARKKRDTSQILQ